MERRHGAPAAPQGEFIEIHVDTPLSEAERRDEQGLYRKAGAGMPRNLTGIDPPCEPPLSPGIRIETMAMNPEQAADRVVELMPGEAQAE